MRLSPLVLSSLALAPALLAQRIPEAASHSTAATAQVVPLGIQVDCNLSVAFEQDWYTFTLPAATRIRIHTSSGDTRIGLTDVLGTTYLGIDDDGRTTVTGFSSDITLNIAAGTYCVQVVGWVGTTTGLYSLDISELTPVVYDGTEVEPNDTYLTATPTTVGSGASRYLGNVGPATLQVADIVAATATVLADAVAAPVTVLTDTVVLSTTTVITATTAMTASAYIGSQYFVSMTSGPNLGLQRLISANTATTITTAAFPVASLAGNTYDIVRQSTTTITQATAVLTPSAYIGGTFAILMTSGLNVGLQRTISANTATTITAAAFPVANLGSDTYNVVNNFSTTSLIRPTSALVAGAWTPLTAGFGRFYVRFTSGVNSGLYRQITSNTATTISCSVFPAAPAASDAFIVELCDVDYYQVVLTAPATGLWFQINEGDAPWVYGHRYELYDSLGVLLAPVSSTTVPAFGTNSANVGGLVARTSSTRVWPAGTYYIAVRSPAAPSVAAVGQAGGVVHNGNYMLELFGMPMDTGGIVAETELAGGPQSNNTGATAIPIVPGQIGQGNVTISTGADPSDWWGPIVISTPSTLAYQVRDGVTATPMLDSTINLRDSLGNIAVASTGGNILDVSTSSAGLHARATVSFFLTPSTYYIEVISPGTAVAQSGHYELQIGAAIPAPYVAASYALFAANATCAVAPFPTLTRQFVSEVPATGSWFSRQLTNMTPSFVGLHVMGFSNPAPLDLAAVFGGTLGVCFLNVSADVINTVVTNPAGVVELGMFIPSATALRGAVLWEQGFDLDLLAPNGFFLQPGNYARFIIGERSY